MWAGGGGPGGGGGRGLYWMDYGDRDGPKPQVTAAQIRRILSYLRPYTGLTLLVLACIGASALVGVVSPLLVRGIIDQAVPNKDWTLLNWLVIALVVTPITSGLISVLQQYLNSLISQAIMSDLRLQLFAHLQRQSLRFYTVTQTGQIMSRVNNDVSGVQNAITGTLASIAQNIAAVTFTVATIVWLDWRLAILALLIVPVVIIPTRRVGRFRREVSRKMQEKQAELTAYLQERLSISGYILARVFGRQRDELGEFGRLNRELMMLQIRSAMVGRWFFMFVGAVASVGPALVYWFGGREAITGTMTIGTVIAFVAYLGNMYRPIGSLANIYVDVQGALAVFERIFEYLDLVPDIREEPNALVLGPVQGRIAFEEVHFTYPSPPPGRDGVNAGSNGTGEGASRGRSGRGVDLAGNQIFGTLNSTERSGNRASAARQPGRRNATGSATPHASGGIARPASELAAGDQAASLTSARPRRPALDGVSFEIEPGQLVALVGHSGAGKTTATYLIPRFYDPNQGRVTLDGQDLRDVSMDSLAAQFGIVTQESFLFHDTLHANLLYARPGATEAELIQACKAANIHDFIVSLPEGYETVVGERGFRLSGGEKQRVSIARAILKDPRILIMDEATSSLDSASEYLIQQALGPLMRGRTSVVIAHRLSTILAADLILVFASGKVVEQGTHASLVDDGGVYYELYRIQFRDAARQLQPHSAADGDSADLTS